MMTQENISALQESEARYRELFGSMQEVFFICELLRDQNGKAMDYRYLEANPACYQRAGRTREEMVGHTYRELFRPNPTFETWLSYFDPVEETGNPVHFEQFAEATGLYFEVSAFRPKAGQVAVLMNDITGRKKAEEIVQEAGTRLQIALDATQLAVHDYNVLTGEIRWDRRLREMWGVDAEEPVTFDVFMSGIHPDDRAMIQAAMDRAVDPNGPGKFAEEYRIIHRVDQKIYWVYATGQAFFRDGKAFRLVGTAQDITSRKKAEEALRAGEIRELARLKELEALMEAAPAIIWVSRDPACRVITGNKFGYEYLKTKTGVNISVTSPEAREKNTYYHFEKGGQIIPPEELPMQYVSRTGQPLRDYAMDLVFQDGRRYSLFGNTNPLVDEAGKPAGAVGVFTDVSELRKMELQKMQLQTQIEMQHRLLDQRERDRQAIARDIHDGPVQTLSSSLFNIQFTKEAINDLVIKTELEQIALNVRVATQELRQVISELRPPSVIRFGLSRAIHFHAQDFRDKYSEIKVTLRLVDDVALPETTCLTLYRIYQEAMNNIARHSDATKVSVLLTVKGKTLTLRVRDNGKGLPEEQTLDHLTQNGHYGLAGMRERAEALNGKLTVSSRPGQGTMVQIAVPLPGNAVY